MQICDEMTCTIYVDAADVDKFSLMQLRRFLTTMDKFGDLRLDTFKEQGDRNCNIPKAEGFDLLISQTEGLNLLIFQTEGLDLDTG